MTTYNHICQRRGCVNWLLVGDDDKPVCYAFPKGIPDEITQGKNKHLRSIDGDDGIVFTTNIDESYESSIVEKGGPGSGNHGHAGRPGLVGGSASNSASDVFVGVAHNPDWLGKGAAELYDVRQPSGAPIRGQRVITPDDPVVPDTVYHMTTNLSGVLQSGEISARGVGGLGGDNDDQIVSMTTSEEVAKRLTEDTRFVVSMANKYVATQPKIVFENGEWVTRDNKTGELIDGSLWSKAILADFDAQASKEGWKFYPDDYADIQLRTYTLGDWVREFYTFRAYKYDISNPLFFGVENLAGKDPDNIGYLSIPKNNLRTGALLMDFDVPGPNASAWQRKHLLSEIRLYGDVPLNDATYHKEYTSAIIAFDCSNDKTIYNLAKHLPNDPVDGFHITLAFIGIPQQVGELKSRLESFAEKQAPIVGKFNGYAMFEDQGSGMPLVLLYDSPQLPFLRSALRRHFGELIPEQEHGFTPHCTLSYLSKPYKLEFEAFNKTFDTISLWVGEDHYDYVLNGDVVEKGGEGSGNYRHAGRPGKVGGSGSGNYDVDVSMLPLSQGANWTELRDEEYRDFLRSRASKGIKQEIVPYISDMYKYATDDTYTLDNSETVYFGLQGDKFKKLRIGDKFSALGARSTAYTIDRAQAYGKNGAVFQVEIPSGSHALHAKNFDVRELTLLPGAEFEVTKVDKDVISLKLLSDGSEWVQDLYKFQEELNGLASVEKQLPIDDASKANLLEIRKEIFNDLMDDLSEKVFTGQITVGSWEESMRQAVRELHASAAAIAKGGWDQMTWQDWGRIGPMMKEQYRYIHGFAEKIAETRDTISLQAIKARSHMYGEAAGNTAAVMEAGEFAGGTERQPGRFKGLPFMPKDGSTECLTNCKCHWKLDEIDRTKTQKVIQAVWTLTPAEHCDTCLDRNNYTVVLRVPLDTIVPATIGGY